MKITPATGLCIQLLLSVLPLVSGQLGQSAFNDNPLCNKSFADANATGIYYYNPHVDQGAQSEQPDNNSGHTLPIGIAATISATNQSRLAYTVWISPNAANYSDDFSLGYDVCGMVVGPLPDNTNRRGQSDNGSCVQTFDESCVGAMEKAAQKYAVELTLTPSPGPNSNLTQTSLAGVCNDIAQSLTKDLPDLKECRKFVNSSTIVTTPIGLTGYNQSVVYGTDCYVNDTASGEIKNDVFYELQTLYSQNTDQTYDFLATLQNPILAIWMPIANADRPSSIQYSTAGMICALPSNITEGSRKPVALPSPTPVAGEGGSGLSGGAIAGIVVGVLVGVGLIAGLLAWWFLVKRRRAKKAAATSPDVVDEKSSAVNGASPTNGADAGWSPSTEAPDTAVSELPPDYRRPELDAKTNEVFELAPDAKNRNPVELPGSEVPEK